MNSNILVLNNFLNPLNQFENILINKNYDENIRNNLPGFHDYNLIILSDSQRLGLSMAVYILLVVSIFGNCSAFIVTICKRYVLYIINSHIIVLSLFDSW